jgi:hypothetical protein
MAKTKHNPEPTSSRSTMMLMVVGGLLIAGLVVWALTRTVEPPATPAPAPVADATTGAFPPAATPTDTSLTALPTTTQAIPAARPQVQGDRAEVTRIAAEDVRAKLTRGEVVVVDVRDPAAYARSHIPGSINMPFATIEGQADALPKDKGIVTLCT